MKKRFIELSTKWFYTWPAWVLGIFGILATFQFGSTLHTLLYFSPVVLASALFATGHWQGCLPGMFFAFMPMGEYLYNCYLIEYKGMVIYHNWNPWVFTVIVAVYYIFMAYKVYKGRENI